MEREKSVVEFSEKLFSHGQSSKRLTMHSDFLWSELQTRYVSWERHMKKATQALLNEKKAKKV